MTAIVAIADGRNVWMGADSAGTTLNFAIETRRDPKIFAKGDFLVGYAHSFRVGQILEYLFDPPPLAVGEDAMEYMIRQFVPHMRQCLHEHGSCDERATEFGGAALIGWNGDIFSIENDFHVGRVDTGYQATGSGYDIAMGSLYSTDGTDMLPETRIELALNAAEAFNASVRSPFRIFKI